MLAWPETDDQVIRLVGPRPGVLRLGVEDFGDRHFGPVCVAVRDSHVAYALVLRLFVGDVLHQTGEVTLLHRLHGNVLCDHGRPPQFLAAKGLIASPLE